MNKYIFFSYYDWLLLIENYIENKHRHHERDIFFVYNYVKVGNNSLFICYALIYYSYLKIILWNNVVLYLTLKNIETVEIEDKIGRHMVFNFKKFNSFNSFSVKILTIQTLLNWNADHSNDYLSQTIIGP